MCAVRERGVHSGPAESGSARQAREQAEVARLGQFALIHPDLQRVMDEAVDVVSRTLDVDFCKVLELLPGSGELLMRAGTGFGPAYVGHARVDTGPDSQAGHTLRSESPVVVEDLRTETRFRGTSLLIEHDVVSGITCVIRGEEGEPFGVLGAHTRSRVQFSPEDVHFLESVANVLGGAIQRDRAQSALRASEERYRYVLNSVLDPIFIYPLESDGLPGRFVEVNETALRILGYEREELLARTVLDVADVTPEQYRRNIERIRSGEPVIESQYRTKDGRRIPVEVSVRIRELMGREHVITVVRDIAERRRVALELESRNQRLRLLVEAASALLSSDELGHALERVFQDFDPGLGIDGFFHHLRAADGRRLELAGCAGLGPDARGLLGVIRPGRAVYSRLGRDPEPTIIENARSALDPLALHLREFDVTAIMAYPLKASGEIVGTLVFVSRTRDRFEPEAMDLMRALCDQLATSVGRRIALRAERETAARLRALVETAADGILTIDRRGIIESVNTAVERIFGYGSEELIGRRVERLLPRPPSDAPPLFDPIDMEALADARGHEIEARRSDGSRVPLEVTVSATQVNGRTIWTAIVRDISERKHAEESLRESERRFRMLADASPVVIAVADPDGRATYLNRTWMEYTGWSPADVAERDCLEVVHPEDRSASLEALRRAVRERAPFSFELRLRRHDGAYRWFLCQGVPRFGAARDYLGHIGSGVDITSQKEAEDQLLRLNVRLQRLNETLEERIARRTERLERQSERLRRLAAELTRAEQRERDRLAALVHDHLQQLLVAARMRLELAAERSHDSALKPLLANASEMMDESLDVTRSLTAELRPPVLRELGLAAALEWLSERMREQHDLQVTAELDAAAEPRDDTVRAILFESARELLFNVVKHADAGAARLSTARTPGGAMRLVVEDRGRGFDPAELEGDRSSIDRFGLFSIQERLRAMGGDVRIRSRPGCGTRVELRAPLGLDSGSPNHGPVAPD